MVQFSELEVKCSLRRVASGLSCIAVRPELNHPPVTPFHDRRLSPIYYRLRRPCQYVLRIPVYRNPAEGRPLSAYLAEQLSDTLSDRLQDTLVHSQKVTLPP
jgi:hypothetical protein